MKRWIVTVVLLFTAAGCGLKPQERVELVGQGATVTQEVIEQYGGVIEQLEETVEAIQAELGPGGTSDKLNKALAALQDAKSERDRAKALLAETNAKIDAAEKGTVWDELSLYLNIALSVMGVYFGPKYARIVKGMKAARAALGLVKRVNKELFDKDIAPIMDNAKVAGSLNPDEL